MDKITFEQLPEAVAEILSTIRRIEAILLKNGIADEQEILNIEQACSYMNLSKSAIYKKTTTGEIPHIKYGKYLRFEKQALKEVMLQYRIKSNAQIEEEAVQYIANNPLVLKKRR